MKKILTTIVIIIAAIVTFGVYQNNERGESVVVGVITPMTGEVSSMGELVVKAINLESYKNIKVIFEDDACDPKKAITAYNHLKLSNVKIFYVACSGSVLALAPLARENNDLIVTAYAGSAEIRKTGDEVIRFIPDAESIGLIIVDYLNNQPKKKLALLYEDQAYAHSITKIIKTKTNSEFVAEETYAGDSADFRSQLTKIKASGATDIILAPVSEKTTYTIYKQMNTLGMKQNIIGEVNVCDYEKAAPEFGIDITCWKAQLDKQKADLFEKKYVEKYNEKSAAAFYDAATHDVMFILDKAIDRIGRADVDEIKKYILSGVSGPINSYEFDGNGELVNAGKYLKIVLPSN